METSSPVATRTTDFKYRGILHPKSNTYSSPLSTTAFHGSSLTNNNQQREKIKKNEKKNEKKKFKRKKKSNFETRRSD